MQSLVLDGDSPAGLEALQSLGRAGVWTDVCCREADSLVLHSRYARRRFRQPAYVGHHEFIAWLRALDAVHRYTLIVPATEGSVLALRRLAETDALRVKAILPSDEALDAALDKQQTIDLALKLGLPVPHSRLITSLERLERVAEFPVVLKPVRSTIEKDGKLIVVPAEVVRDKDARLDFLRTWVPHVPVLQQTYVRGHGVGIELLFDHGQEIWHFAHERIHEIPLTGGGSSYRRSLRPPAKLLESARRLLKSLRWHGVAMVELKVQPDGTFYLMEINPRLWGSLALARDAGVDFPRALLAIAAGEPARPQPAYRESYYTRNLIRDIPWLKANWRANHRDPVLLTRPRVTSVLEYLRPLWGRESWDYFDVRDLSVTGAILERVVLGQIAKGKEFLRRRLLRRKIVKQHVRRYCASDSPRSTVGRLLFLCFGNICRSPFAEQVAKAKLGRYDVESAGFHATADRESPEGFVHIAGAMGIDIAKARSKRLTARQVAGADLILVLDLDTYERLAAEFPDALPRTTLLGLFASEPVVSIPDPYRMPETETRRILRLICAAVDGLSNWLNAAEREGKEFSAERVQV